MPTARAVAISTNQTNSAYQELCDVRFPMGIEKSRVFFFKFLAHVQVRHPQRKRDVTMAHLTRKRRKDVRFGGLIEKIFYPPH